MSSVTIDYNPNDFFYVSADTITDSSCNNSTTGYKLLSDDSCNFYIDISQDLYDMSINDVSYNHFKTNLEKCFNKEVCVNKDQSVKVDNVQNNNLENQNYKNTMDIYYNEYLKSFNLIMGITFLIVTIIYIK